MKHVTVRTQKHYCIVSYLGFLGPCRFTLLNCFFSQVHIALDDQTGEKGGLHFVPGSHRSQHCT